MKRGLSAAAVIANLFVTSIAGASTFVVTTVSNAGTGSFREAITLANAAGGSNTIDLTKVAGTISLETPLPSIKNTLDVMGPGASVLTVRRSPTAPKSGVFALATGANMIVSRLTVRDGDEQSTTLGGAFTISGGSLTLSECVITNNVANFGAAIFGLGTLTIDRSTLTNNMPTNQGTISLGIGSKLTVTGSTFSGNGARTLVLNTTTTSIADSVFSKNAGAIFTDAGVLEIDRSTFSENAEAQARGGAITVGAGTVATVRDSTFSNNSAADGGAGHVFVLGGSVTLQRSTLALGTGGGSGATALVLRFLTGGTSTATLDSSIVSGTGRLCFVASGAGPITSLGHNLATDDTCNLIQTTDKPKTDPQLAPLADYCGPTPTHALHATSPAIGAGKLPSVPGTDQRGFARVAFGTIDIGAYEYGKPCIVKHPLGQTLASGSTLTLDVGVSEPDPPTFAWKKGTTTLTSATSSTYTKPSVVAADSGDYVAVVTNVLGGVATSEIATVLVTDPQSDAGNDAADSNDARDAVSDAVDAASGTVDAASEAADAVVDSADVVDVTDASTSTDTSPNDAGDAAVALDGAAPDPVAASDDSSGCGCVVGRASGGTAFELVTLLAAALVARRRRKDADGRESTTPCGIGERPPR